MLTLRPIGHSLAFEKRLEELTLVEEQAEVSQAELSRAVSTKSKLESLFRQLQQQTATLTEERRQLTEAERQRRQEISKPLRSC